MPELLGSETPLGVTLLRVEQLTTTAYLLVHTYCSHMISAYISGHCHVADLIQLYTLYALLLYDLAISHKALYFLYLTQTSIFSSFYTYDIAISTLTL